MENGQRVTYHNDHDDERVPPKNGDVGTVVQVVPGSPFVKVFWDLYGVILIVHARHLR
jgi:hypothetical protein